MLLQIFLVFVLLESISARCPTGAVQGLASTDCYKFVAAADRWFEAEWTCVTKEGHLASVSSAFENSFFLSEGPVWCSDSYWIGGTNTEGGNWAWSDAKAFAYSNWDRGQPMNGSNQCLASETDTGKWSSEQCHLTKPFVCKVPSLRDDNRDPPTPATCPTPLAVESFTTATEGVTKECVCETKPHGTRPTPHPFPQCPIGWSYVNVTNQCWKVFYNVAWSWIYATCMLQNATIVSIHSPEVNEAVTEFMCPVGNCGRWGWAWLPLSAPDGRWAWFDESTVDYTNWAMAGTPDALADCTGFISFDSAFVHSVPLEISW